MPRLIESPTVIEAAGNKPKLIEEPCTGTTRREVVIQSTGGLVVTLRSLFALLAGVLVLLACGERAETESYSVRGQVVRVADGGRSLVVEHEAIPGLMDAMRMTFPVQDAAASKGIAAGDRIRFDLFVSDGDYVIGAIEKLPADTELDLSGSLH